MTIDIPSFRQTMALFPGAVTVITTGTGEDTSRDHRNRCLLGHRQSTQLTCVCEQSHRNLHGNRALWALQRATLGAGACRSRDGLCRRWRAQRLDKFDLGDWQECTRGLPRLRGALASLSCEVLEDTEAGTHRIFIGRIEDVAITAGEALVYAGARFHRLTEQAMA